MPRGSPGRAPSRCTGLVQMEADEARYGGLRHSLWTGDEGFAIYLWDCIRGAAAFPTVDVFYAA